LEDLQEIHVVDTGTTLPGLEAGLTEMCCGAMPKMTTARNQERATGSDQRRSGRRKEFESI
jgi:hypothetical protein